MLASILNGQCLPTFAQLQDLINYCPAIGERGKTLLTEAQSGQLAEALASGRTAAGATQAPHPASSPVRLAVRQAPLVPRSPSDAPSKATTAPGAGGPAAPPSRPRSLRRRRPGGSASCAPMVETRRWRVVWPRPAVQRARAWFAYHSRLISNVALALVLTVLVAVPVAWTVRALDEHFTPVAGVAVGKDLSAVAGDIPAVHQNIRGDFLGVAWPGIVSGSPQSTTFEPVDKSTPYQGLRGVMWLQHDPGCSPAVALRVLTADGSSKVLLLRDNPVDLAFDIDVDPDWNTRFRVELTRLDADGCPLSVMWSDASTQ